MVTTATRGCMGTRDDRPTDDRTAGAAETPTGDTQRVCMCQFKTECVRVCACECACMRVCACGCACVFECARVCVGVSAENGFSYRPLTPRHQQRMSGIGAALMRSPASSHTHTRTHTGRHRHTRTHRHVHTQADTDTHAHTDTHTHSQGHTHAHTGRHTTQTGPRDCVLRTDGMSNSSPTSLNVGSSGVTALSLLPYANGNTFRTNRHSAPSVTS